MVERLQKYMARCGVASRRSCEKIISQGRTSINGKIVKSMGVKVDPSVDEVRVDGKIISPEINNVYIILNKPAGYITTVSDPHGRPTVLDLIGPIKERIFPVGRLDLMSEGLLILTNDGELAYLLAHPKYEIKKQYSVVINGHPTDSQVHSLRSGLDIGGYITRPADVKLVGKTHKTTTFNVVIHEGRKRQIRLMFKAIGYDVVHLKRERLANIEIGSLPRGEWRHLSPKEVQSLIDMVREQDFV